MNKIFVKNFRIKLAIFLIIAALIPIATLEVINIYDSFRYETHMLKEYEKVHLESQFQVFDYWLSKKEMEMQSMMVLFEEQVENVDDPSELNLVLDLLLLKDSDIVHSYYTTETGLNLVSGGQQGIVDGRNRRWYKDAISDAITISTPYEDALTGQQVVTLSGQIYKSNALEGVLGIDIVFHTAVKIFFDPINESFLELIVKSDDGDIVYTSSNFSEDEINRYLSGEKKTIDVFADVATYSYDIEALGSKAYLIIDLDDFFESSLGRHSRRSSDQILLITLVGFVVMAAFVVSKIVNRPILALENNAKAIVEGELTSVPQSGFIDLDDIAQLFDKFQKTISKNSKSIVNMSDELDERNKTLIALNEEYEKAYNELEKFSVALAQKESEYENLVGNIIDLIWSVDANGLLTYGNEKILEALSYEDEEFVGMALSDIVPSFRMNYGNDPYALLYSRDYDAIDIEFIDRHNEKIILTSTSTTRIFQNNQLVSIQGVSRDVTLEKKMYHELHSRNKDLMLINKIGKEMTMTDNLDSVLKLILENVDATFEVKVASIRFMDRDGRLKVKAFQGEEKELLWSKDSMEVLHSHVGYAIEQRQVVILNTMDDLFIDSDQEVIDAISKGYKIISLPLSNGDSSFGALSIMAIDTIDDRVVAVLSAFANSTSVALERALLFETLQHNYVKTIEALVTAMEAKNHLMQGHSTRVSKLSGYIGEKLYLSQEEVSDLYVAGLLHDVGKIGLRDAVLRQDFKVQRKSLNEAIIENHIEIGKKILSPIGLKERILQGVYYHHKQFDQSGYPKEALNEVPLFALIIGVADDIDIMMKRNLDSQLTLEEMKQVLLNSAGSKYSPEIVNLVVELIEREDELLIKIINDEM